jgi:hypothetical protein
MATQHGYGSRRPRRWCASGEKFLGLQLVTLRLTLLGASTGNRARAQIPSPPRTPGGGPFPCVPPLLTVVGRDTIGKGEQGPGVLDLYTWSWCNHPSGDWAGVRAICAAGYERRRLGEVKLARGALCQRQASTTSARVRHKQMGSARQWKTERA